MSPLAAEHAPIVSHRAMRPITSRSLGLIAVCLGTLAAVAAPALATQLDELNERANRSSSTTTPAVRSAGPAGLSSSRSASDPWRKPANVAAGDVTSSADTSMASPPSDLRAMRDVQADPSAPSDDKLRLKATVMREKAIAYGAQGGLAYRSWEINRELAGQTAKLDQIYNFPILVVPLSGGGYLIPPIASEADRAISVSDDGTVASTAKKVMRITSGRISTTIPSWKGYLLRKWPETRKPETAVLPANEREREEWAAAVLDGWELGVRQAEAVFKADSDRLLRDFEGMALYRRWVAQGLVEDIYLAEADRGVTGGGDTMRIGDRTVRITSPARLNPQSDTWQPVVLDPRSVAVPVRREELVK